MPVYAGLAYDAVVVLANSFHRILMSGKNINDGLQVIEGMKNLTYQSILGFSVKMDDNGTSSTFQDISFCGLIAE